MPPRCSQAALVMVPPVRDPNTALAIMPLSSAIPTAIASKRSLSCKPKAELHHHLHALNHGGRDLLLGPGDAGGGCAQFRQNLCNVLCHEQIDRIGRTNEGQICHTLDEGAQRIPKALHVENKDGLVVPAELSPGELLDQLLKRPDAAGQRNESVCSLEHDALSLMHVARDNSLLRTQQQVLAADKEIGNDARNRAALVEDSLGDVPTGTLEFKTIFAVGMTLFVMTLCLNLASHRLVTRYRQKYE